jgi:hypothetical protein
MWTCRNFRRVEERSPATFGFVLTWALAAAAPASAQTTEVKEKPPLYPYVGSFALPRAKWADLAKQNAAEQKLFDKALSSGQLVGYGTDEELVHTNDGYTNDSFWSSMSLAGVLGVLDDLEKGGSTTGSVLSSATKHDDSVLVSRYFIGPALDAMVQRANHRDYLSRTDAVYK